MTPLTPPQTPTPTPQPQVAVQAAAYPGWYPDPLGGAGQRYWDGQRWLDNTPPKGTDSKNDGLVTAGWITAILFPLIGLIVGIVVSGRNDKRGTSIIIAAVVAFVVWIFIWVAINKSNEETAANPYGAISLSASVLE
ncbi:MAG: DUF2510 domain-containing protein [Solirubrobacterales bacterium]